MNIILERFNKIKSNIKEASESNAETIVAVSKTFTLDHVMPLIDYGHMHYGENKVQEAQAKWSKIKNEIRGLRLHMIGKLQSNKAHKAVELFDYIHSVDSQKLADVLSKTQNKINRSIKSGKKIYDFTNTEQSTNYCDVIKSVKKENITKENIGEIMLMQIPGISSVLAKAILSRFSSFSDFINKVNTEPGCLNGMTYESKGKERKINKSCLENIVHYLNSNSN